MTRLSRQRPHNNTHLPDTDNTLWCFLNPWGQSRSYVAAQLPALTAAMLRVCKSEASGLTESQTRLLWHVKQLLVCLGLSCPFSTATTNIILSAHIFGLQKAFLGRTQNNGSAGCRAVTLHFSLSSVKTLLSGIPPRPRWLCCLLHFGFHEKRI